MNNSIDAEDLLERFCRYVRIDTRSDPHSPTCPSTPGQWDLLRLLEQELKQLGLADVRLTADGYVLATIPATSPKAGVPRLAWIAHAGASKATETPRQCVEWPSRQEGNAFHRCSFLLLAPQRGGVPPDREHSHSTFVDKGGEKDYSRYAVFQDGNKLAPP